MTRGATECRSRAVRTGLARAPTSCVPASTPWHHRRLPPGQGAGRRDASAALPGRGEARRAPDRRDHGHQPGGPHRSQGQVGRHLRRPAAERRPQVQAARGRRVHQGHAREACAHLTLAPTLTLTLTPAPARTLALTLAKPGPAPAPKPALAPRWIRGGSRLHDGRRALYLPTSPCISPYLPISPYLSAYVPGVDLRLHDGGGAARWRLGGRGRGDAS